MTSTLPPKYGLFGSLRAGAGKGDELATILLAAADLVSTAPGCLLYLVSRDVHDDTLVWINEVWDREQDHDYSLHTAGVKELGSVNSSN